MRRNRIGGESIVLSLDKKNFRIILGALFVFLFLVPLALHVVTKPWRAHVLFFPEMNTGQLVGERRFLPRRTQLSSRVELYVQELVLGPTDPLLTRIVPRDVRLHSVIERQAAVYVSLSREILAFQPDVPLSFEQTLQTIANGVLYNFPEVRTLHLLVEGQLPGDQYSDGFVFDKKLLK